jgi:hypothetical protein
MAQYSGPGFVLFRGVPVLQASTVNFQVMTDNKDVNTLLLGRAGHSKGAKKVQIQVENAVPQAGYEIDWPAIAAAQAEVPLTFRIANKTYNCTGDVRDVDIKSSVDASNSLGFTFHGRVVSEL